jgi:hypothetical protein
LEAHWFGHPGNGGFPGEDFGQNGAHVLSQSPPLCPHVFATWSFRQSVGSVHLDLTSILKKLIILAAAAPPDPAFVALQFAMQWTYLSEFRHFMSLIRS